MMKLKGFRVTNFRSVDDSGWIDTGTVTSLIGTNESGKTNLIVPLWKLNPAKDGDINPIADYPRKRYNEIRSMEEKPIFIRAQFELDDPLAGRVAAAAGCSLADVKTTEVTRNLAGKYTIGFPSAKLVRTAPKPELKKILDDLHEEAQNAEALKKEEALKGLIETAIASLRNGIKIVPDEVNGETIKSWLTLLENIDTSDAGAKSEIAPVLANAIAKLTAVHLRITRPHPSSVDEARKLVRNSLPSMVYYSNYGNLDSEIYLPHVIDNMKRTDLGSKEEAKARTLKVLFEFVRLKPEEIRELGREHQESEGSITQEQIAEIARKKTERDILLQSASTDLTHKFRDWWKQGDYRFRFSADGDHFRIWVSDDRRPEDVELEGRSTGLQWFLSFYLIFLVESQDSHEGAILLLDEPGISLHPIAQKDLSAFFENLSEANQLLYTTHSPFLIDSDHLDRVRSVYVDKDGTTRASSDLRASENIPAQTHSAYPAHAALGLSVSETFLQGCRPVIVEGTSDLYYLGAIKNRLIGEGLITPKREIVFLPSGGTRGVKAMVGLVMGKDEALPRVIIDNDQQGQSLEANLRNGLYADDSDRVITTKDLTTIDLSEVEDLLPHGFLADVISRYFRRSSSLNSDDEFIDVVKENEPIIPQAETYAQSNNIELEKGWKVEIAKMAKLRLPKENSIPKSTLDMWKGLFEQLNVD